MLKFIMPKEKHTQPSMPNTQNCRDLAKFLVPSFIGITLFMIPISYKGALSIPVAIFAKSFQSLIEGQIITIVSSIIVFMAIASFICAIHTPKAILEKPFLRNLFKPTQVWLITRILGGLATVMTYFKFGPEIFWGENTGGLVLNGLLPTLFSVFLFAGLLLPLLLNFGLLELLGTLLSKIMRPVFNLPGRSAIDCMASWLGDGSIGILMTSKQFEQKFYTQREAAVVGTTFSAVSITFSLVVIAQVKLEHMFVPFYIAVCLAGLISAIILPRIPPLSRKSPLFIDGSKADKDSNLIPAGYNSFNWGLKLALKKATNANSFKGIIKEGLSNSMDMIMGILPVVMGLGTIALIIAEHTPIFDILGLPFIPLLKLLGIPEASAASHSIVVGFTDMFIPSILAASIESEMTRFIIAAVSVTQLIYMSEVGALLLGSKIPITFIELFIIFILRTLVTLPIITGIAHLIF